MAAAATAIAGTCLSAPTTLAKSSDPPRGHTIKSPWLNKPWKKSGQFESGGMFVRPVAAAPEGLSDKVAESIKSAEEACAGDPVSGECAAAWDEVEELSAAVSHAREKQKESDPLESFCKDNPETDECRTYDN
ncbi:hypothetical protein U1Q18_019944 [Sarracenia purpurea var. burkii]